MSIVHGPKKGSRVSGVQMPPNRFEIAWDVLKRADVLFKIGMCFLAAFVVWIVTSGWKPPFPFRQGKLPSRDITASVEFQSKNEEGTEEARQRFRRNFITIYSRDDQGQPQALREELITDVKSLLRFDSWEALSQDPAAMSLWGEFMNGLIRDPDPDSPPTEDEKKSDLRTYADRFEQFRNAFADDPDAKQMDVLDAVMRDIYDAGILNKPQHTAAEGSVSKINVATSESFAERTVSELSFAGTVERLKEGLRTQLPTEVADHFGAWFSKAGRLQETLTFNSVITAEQRAAQIDSLPPVMNTHLKGDKLAEGHVPLSAESISLLRMEYEQIVGNLSLWQNLGHTFARFGMYGAAFTLCGFYCVFRQQKSLMETATLARALCLVVVTVALCWFAPNERPETVIVPLLLFAMTAAIAYEQEVALLLSTVIAVVVVASLGFGFTEFTIYVAGMATAILCLRHVRSRTKLIYVGLTAAAVSGVAAIGAPVIFDPSQGMSLFTSAGWFAFFAVIAGLLMTGLLPFIESLFDVQTELSLLELGDVAHPLLQELVRRAPGTYNHTINVASIAEAAAEAIRANGLLVRVGAYFHDIGKMLKPGYFIENQGLGDNRHESLLPAMSTLVIIAHVKDGADLARQHGLPNSLIDFILQHHGTTLVEYFYNRASEQSESDPDGGEVDEHSYRYPGPKPQSKEAAVLMMADAVESACRALTDPTPSRIEGLVHDLAMKRLLDGQFDECGLTLEELRKIELSLVKSLAAVYHARIKYPDTQTA